MADFCNQCARELGLPEGDFRGVGDHSEILGYEEGFCVLCEGCGMTFVDHAGNCINPTCKSNHAVPPDDVVRVWSD